MLNFKEELLRRIKEEEYFTCGASLVPADHNGLEMVVKEAITCLSEVETNYFTASLRYYLPPICIHCGSAEDLLDDSDPYMHTLYDQFSVARPICSNCRNSGKTRKLGAKNLSQKKLDT